MKKFPYPLDLQFQKRYTVESAFNRGENVDNEDFSRLTAQKTHFTDGGVFDEIYEKSE